MIKKIIALFLSFVMVFLLAGNIFAVSNKTVNYVSLGSSGTLGFGLDTVSNDKYRLWENTEKQRSDWEKYGWQADAWDVSYGANTKKKGYNMLGVNTYGFQQQVKGSFPMLIKAAIEKQGFDVNFSQLACLGMRVDDLRLYLYDDYKQDFFSRYLFSCENGLFEQVTGYSGLEGIEYFRKLYRNALKDADFVTFDLGANNFGVAIVNLFYEVMEFDYKNLLGDDYYLFESTRELIRNCVKNFLNKAGIDETSLSQFEYFVDGITYTYLGYCTGLDKCMEWIYDNNPDVNVAVLQVQNYFSGYTVKIDGIDVAVGDLLNLIISMANSYASSLSKYCTKYTYVKVTDNQRISFNTDDIRAYEGPEDLKEYQKVILDIQSYTFNLKSDLTPIYTEAGRELHDEYYDEVLLSAYDAAFKIFKYIDLNCQIDISYAFIDGDEDAMSYIVKKLLKDIVYESIQGRDNAFAIEKTKEYIDDASPEFRTALAMYITWGGVMFLHPSDVGYMEIAEAVISTMKENTKLPNTPVNLITNLLDNRKSIVKSVKKIITTSVKLPSIKPLLVKPSFK